MDFRCPRCNSEYIDVTVEVYMYHKCFLCGYSWGRSKKVKIPDFVQNIKNVKYKPIKISHGWQHMLEEDMRLRIKQVVFQPPQTIVKWSDGTTTIVKISGEDEFREDYGLAMAISRKVLLGRNNFVEVMDGAIRQDGMSLKEFDTKIEERRKKRENKNE